MEDNNRELFLTYLNNLDTGHYIVPRVLIIADIVKKKYKENVDIKYVLNFDKLREYDFFLEILKHENNDVIDPYLLENYFGKPLSLTIRYPEIHITNSNNLCHTIRDLFVNMEFNRQGFIEEGFDIQRSTFTKEELVVRYVHSHTPTMYEIDTRCLKSKYNPCTGTGDFAASLSAIKGYGGHPQEEESEITRFFTLLDAFLSWESLEGVPYISIGKLSQIGGSIDNTNSAYLGISNPIIEDLNKALSTLKLKDKIKIVPSSLGGNPWYKLVYDELTLNEFLFKEFDEKVRNPEYYSLNRLVSNHSMAYKDELGRVFYRKSNFNRDFEEVENFIETHKDTTLFHFKKEPVKFKVFEQASENKTQLTKVMPRDIFLSIITNLELKINLKYGETDLSKSLL